MRLPALLLAAVLAACGGEEARAGAETAAADARSAWVRVTPEGLRALPSLAGGAIGGTVEPDGSRRIPIGAQRQGDFALCPRGDCAVRLWIDAIEARPAGRASVMIEARARATTGQVPVRYEQTWPCAFSGRPECVVDVDTSRTGEPTVTGQARIHLDLDRPTGLLRPALTDVGMSQGVDSADVQISGSNVCGSIWCSAANIVGASGMISERLNEALGSQLREQAGMIPSPVAMRTAIEPADRGAEAVLAFALADEALVERSAVDLAARLTATRSRVHRCVPAAEPPAAVPLPRDVLGVASRGDRAHVRIAIGEAAIARAAWALHQAGVMCVDAGPERIPQLTPALLGALLPATRDLVSLRVGAPSIAVRPLHPPEVRFEANGTITIAVRRVRIELWAEVDRRALRLAAAHVDVRGTAQLVADAQGLALATPRARVGTRVRDTWSAPALGADRDELRALFAALARVAIDTLPERTALGPATPEGEAPSRDAILARRLRLAERPRTVEVPSRIGRETVARALVIDLRFESAP